jgi:DNA-binding NarL/FixJ family response regulator
VPFHCLLVEANPSLRRGLAGMIARLIDVRVTEGGDAVDALGLLDPRARNRDKFDGIILSRDAGRIDKFEFLSRLGRDFPRTYDFTPVFVLTADAGEETRVRTMPGFGRRLYSVKETPLTTATALIEKELKMWTLLAQKNAPSRMAG